MGYVPRTGYKTIADCTSKPIEQYVNDHWVKSGKATCLQKTVAAPVAYVALGCLSFLARSLDTMIMIVSGCGVILTAGKNEKIYTIYANHMLSAEMVLARTLRCFLKAINPKIVTNSDRDMSDQQGLICPLFLKQLSGKIEFLSKDINFFKRHIVCRVLSGGCLLINVIARLFDAVIMFFLAAASLVTWGRYESVNKLAYRALKAPAVIGNIIYMITKIINPSTGDFGS